MSYTKIFDPEKCVGAARAEGVPDGARRAGDRSNDSVYIYTDELVLAVNVALATGRPLLLRGLPGTGKSSLARNVAECLGWRYYEEVVTSRTQGRELQWRFDTLRRLSDAHAGVLKKENATRPYVEPGVLWWALDRGSASRRGLAADAPNIAAAMEPGAPQPDHARAVVLLDEIDKADPDVPNNLLVALGSYKFYVPELHLEVPETETGTEGNLREPPLVIITTNDERELPAAFLRRCVIYVLKRTTTKRLIEIAEAHFGKENRQLYETVAALMEEGAPKEDGTGATPPSTAEFLDAIDACLTLKVKDPRAEKEDWETISSATLWKPRERLDATT
jgi:MoxR-like ATPase